MLKNRRIPHWFKEGLANFVARSGGEGISQEMAIRFIKEGRHLVIQEKGGFLKSLTKVILAAVLTGPMFHQQNKMFVNYIQRVNPEAFKKLVLAIQNGKKFSTFFVRYFKMNPQEMWDRFKSEL
jgi:hypothetical protein